MLMEAFLLSWVKRFLEMHEASITKETSNTGNIEINETQTLE